VEIAGLQIPDDFEVPDMIKDRARDWKAAWFIAQTAGVVAIPPTVCSQSEVFGGRITDAQVQDFYSEAHWPIGEQFVSRVPWDDG
jgi:kynurenine aminotransferase